MTFPRLTRRCPAFRPAVDHNWGAVFVTTVDLIVTWSRGAPPINVVRHSGLSLLGIPRTKVRFIPGVVSPPPPVAGFDALRRAILDGFVSQMNEAHGWNIERANIPDTAVVRVSDTVVTITLPPLPAYSITAPEIIDGIIPGEAVSTAGQPITATPSIDVATS